MLVGDFQPRSAADTASCLHTPSFSNASAASAFDFSSADSMVRKHVPNVPGAHLCPVYLRLRYLLASFAKLSAEALEGIRPSANLPVSTAKRRLQAARLRGEQVKVAFPVE